MQLSVAWRNAHKSKGERCEAHEILIKYIHILTPSIVTVPWGACASEWVAFNRALCMEWTTKFQIKRKSLGNSIRFPKAEKWPRRNEMNKRFEFEWTKERIKSEFYHFNFGRVQSYACHIFISDCHCDYEDFFLGESTKFGLSTPERREKSMNNERTTHVQSIRKC